MVCAAHPDEPQLGYIAACADADTRLKRREHQVRCGRCGLWVWAAFMIDLTGALTEHQYRQFVRFQGRRPR